MIICEPVCENMEHVPFNSKFISQTLLNNPNEAIKVCCSQSHWQCLKSTIEPELLNRIFYHQISPVCRRTKPFQWIKQLLLLVKLKSNSNKNEKWLFLSTTVPIYWWLCHMFKGHNSTVIFHSILAEIEGWIPRNPILKYLSLRTTFIRYAGTSPKIILLERYIRDSLVKIIPEIANKVSVFPHPLPNDAINENISNHTHVVISFPGNFSENKGAYEFLNIAKLYTSSFFDFCIVGKNSLPLSVTELASNFSYGPFTDYLTRELYADKIQHSDFIFISQSDSHYKWTASGVILDILHFQKPIIARKTKILALLTNNKWDIGYFYDTESELKAVFAHLEVNKANISLEYEQFILNLNKLKQQRLSEYDTEIKNLNL